MAAMPAATARTWTRSELHSLVVIAALTALAACSPSTVDAVRADGTGTVSGPDERAQQAGCPRLRPPLPDLAFAADPGGEATARRVEHDGTRARVSMRTSRDDADLENHYGVRVVSRTPLGWLSVDIVQALVPFGQLCPLASDWRILRIEAVRPAMPDGAAPGALPPPSASPSS